MEMVGQKGSRANNNVHGISKIWRQFNSVLLTALKYAKPKMKMIEER